MRAFLILCLLFFLSSNVTKAQHSIVLSDVVFKIDTAFFSMEKNQLTYNNEKRLYFITNANKKIAGIRIIPQKNISVQSIQLIHSPDYDILDSLRPGVDGMWFGKLLFEDLLYNPDPVVSFVIKSDHSTDTIDIKLLPVFATHIQYPEENIIDMFQEEEKVIDLPADAAFNIITDNVWTITDEYDYKISNTNGIVYATIKPHFTGFKEFTLTLKTIKPILSGTQTLSNSLPLLKIRCNVKPNRLYFVNTDKKIIYLDPSFKTTQEIQIDYNKNIVLKKYYRIEDSQEGEGNLIAELYTISLVENSSKVICRIKPYSVHKVSDGYLYLKDGTRAAFVTNFNTLERPRIDKISVMHEHDVWTGNLSVHPGESFDLKIEGKGLDNATFSFEGCTYTRDTLTYSDEIVFYHVRVPLKIASRVISVTMNKSPTSYDLYVAEYQVPAPLDFVYVNYGANNIPLTSEKLNKPVFYENAIEDINLTFSPAKIDENNTLYGVQYLDVQIKIFNSKNDLIEIQDVQGVVICPAGNSPRAGYYMIKDCNNAAINFNDYLLHKTYKLEGFTQIEITVKHSDSFYSSKGFSRKIKIILIRKVHFDIQVSLPSGLLIKRFNEPGYGTLTGISMAILAQFNFYSPRVIGKLRPYNIGGGFIALNAFNFNTSASNPRDVGIVILGSVYPVKTGSKFSIPIYAGGGYLLNADTWFIMFGPGIQFNF
ncbi:MAG: hypothetical protein H7259_05880 [Cytophagales bacterium]|nr:hypothetical protein [Cytophaga sp.]